MATTQLALGNAPDHSENDLLLVMQVAGGGAHSNAFPGATALRLAGSPRLPGLRQLAGHF